MDSEIIEIRNCNAKTYASAAVLSVSDAGARSAETLILTPRVLDALIARFPDIEGATIEAKRRKLADSMYWRAPQGENRRNATLFYFTVEAHSPTLAQQLNVATLDTWLELTKPGPVTSQRLQDQLERIELQLRDANLLITKLENETPAVIAPNSLQGELATPLAGLRTRRDGLIENTVLLRLQLLGSSRDVIFSPPTLPVEHVWPRRGFVVLGALFAYLSLLTAYLIVAYYLMNSATRSAQLASEA